MPYLEYNKHLDVVYLSDLGNIKLLSATDFSTKLHTKIHHPDSTPFLKYCANTQTLLSCAREHRSISILDQKTLQL